MNFEPDGTTRAAPQLMKFHLKGREEDTPLPARLYTPEKQADTLFQRLGFEQTRNNGMTHESRRADRKRRFIRNTPTAPAAKPIRRENAISHA
nr:hypothetical protein [Citrobacter portucalensis]